jgi:hypothetical protein
MHPGCSNFCMRDRAQAYNASTIFKVEYIYFTGECFLCSSACTCMSSVEVSSSLSLCRKEGVEPDVWALPGGHLEHGESFEQCAERELLEETGLQIEHAHFVWACNTVFESNHHYVTIFVQGTPVDVRPSLHSYHQLHVLNCNRLSHSFHSMDVAFVTSTLCVTAIMIYHSIRNPAHLKLHHVQSVQLYTLP